MATEQDIFDFAVSQNPNLKNKPFRNVVDFAYSQNPNLRNSVVASTAAELPPGVGPEGQPYNQTNIIPKAVENVVGAVARPSVALPLAAGALTGGMGALPAAGLVGLAAAGGKGYELAAEGKNPEEATKDMVIDGLVAGGLDAATAGIAKLAPLSSLKTGFSKMMDYITRGGRPYKAVARAIGRGEAVDLSLGKNAIERSLSKNIEGLQKTIEMQRTSLGKAVQTEGEKLASATSGTRPINIKDTVDEIGNDLASITETPGAGEQIAKSAEAKRLTSMLASLKDGRMSVSDAIRNKRYIDSVVDYPVTAAKPTEMSLLEPTFKKLRTAINDELINTAESVGQKSYVAANKKYGDYMDWYRTDGQAVYSTVGGEKSMADRIRKMGNLFKDIGIKGGVIENSKQFLPKWTHTSIDKLQDDLAAGFFANLMESTPSGLTKDIVKLVAGPGSKIGTKIISKTIPAGRAVQPFASPLPGPAGVLAVEVNRNE